MANVLCCTADDEERFRQTLQELIESEELPEFDTFSKENKKKKSARKRKVKPFSFQNKQDSAVKSDIKLLYIINSM